MKEQVEQMALDTGFDTDDHQTMKSLERFAALAGNAKLTEAIDKARITECRIELVNAIHTLASHYENRLGRLDPEDRKLAEDDIAHAMATAAKWNWNGNGIGGTP